MGGFSAGRSLGCRAGSPLGNLALFYHMLALQSFRESIGRNRAHLLVPRHTLLVPAASRNVPPEAESAAPASAGTPVAAGAAGTAAGMAAAVAAAAGPIAIDVTRPSPLPVRHNSSDKNT